MHTRGYLIIHKAGSVRFIKGKVSYRGSTVPQISMNEIALYLDIELPDALFMRPQLQAKITIPPDTAPQTIEAQVMDNCRDAIEKATGLPVRISLVPPEKRCPRCGKMFVPSCAGQEYCGCAPATETNTTG